MLKRIWSPPSNSSLEIRRYPAITEGNRILFFCSSFPVRKPATNNEHLKGEGGNPTHTAIHFPLHLNFKIDHKPNVPPKTHLMICKHLVTPLSYIFYSTGETHIRTSYSFINYILVVESKTGSELYQLNRWDCQARQFLNSLKAKLLSTSYSHIKVETLRTNLQNQNSICRTFLEHKTSLNIISFIIAISLFFQRGPLSVR